MQKQRERNREYNEFLATKGGGHRTGRGGDGQSVSSGVAFQSASNCRSCLLCQLFGVSCFLSHRFVCHAYCVKTVWCIMLLSHCFVCHLSYLCLGTFVPVLLVVS
jgi:hypothetical protein